MDICKCLVDQFEQLDAPSLLTTTPKRPEGVKRRHSDSFLTTPESKRTRPSPSSPPMAPIRLTGRDQQGEGPSTRRPTFLRIPPLIFSQQGSQTQNSGSLVVQKETTLFGEGTSTTNLSLLHPDACPSVKRRFRVEPMFVFGPSAL